MVYHGNAQSYDAVWCLPRCPLAYKKLHVVILIIKSCVEPILSIKDILYKIEISNFIQAKN